MRTPRARLTVRLMLVACAWVVALAGALLMHRRSEWLSWANTFAGRRAVRLMTAEAAERSAEEAARWGDPVRLRRAAVDYGALEAKYRHYANRPWIAVPPDPPMPD